MGSLKIAIEFFLCANKVIFFGNNFGQTKKIKQKIYLCIICAQGKIV